MANDGGEAEGRMLETLAAANDAGPIGLLGHREERDVEECLREDLAGAEAMATSSGK